MAAELGLRQDRSVLAEQRKVEQQRLFENSILKDKLLAQKEAEVQSPVILFVDIDGTFEGTEANPDVPAQIREFCRVRNIPVVAITSRTEEMTWSKKSHDLTVAAGETPRPAPQLQEYTNENGEKRMRTAPPETIAKYAGQLDFDAVAAQTGAVVYARQKTGEYLRDKVYESTADVATWRTNTLKTLGELLTDPTTGEKLAKLLPIEDAANFQAGLADVSPLEWRVQLDFTAEGSHALSTGATDPVSGGKALTEEEAIAKKQEFKARVKAFKELGNKIGFDLVDDSNPKKGRATLYITRPKANKQAAINRLTTGIAETLGLSKSDLDYWLCGDSYTDVLGIRAFLGLKDGVELANPNSTMLLVGDSRITPVLQQAIEENEQEPHFAGENLRPLTKSLVKYNGEPGEYVYKPRFAKSGLRLILGDLRFPGLKKAETIMALLQHEIKIKPFANPVEKAA